MDRWTVESRPERYRWMDGRTVGWTETDDRYWTIMLSPFPRSNSTLSVSGPAGGLEKTPSDQIFLMNHSVYRPVAPERVSA